MSKNHKKSLNYHWNVNFWRENSNIVKRRLFNRFEFFARIKPNIVKRMDGFLNTVFLNEMTSCNSILKRKLLEVNYSSLILSGCLKFFSSGVLLFYFSNCWQSSIIGHHHHHFCWNIWRKFAFQMKRFLAWFLAYQQP